MSPEDCEGIAQSILDATGLDDRPRADPSVVAVAWAGLALCPEPGAKPHLVDGEIVYPSGASDDAAAYFIGHEVGHDALAYYGVRLSREAEERSASRIACALILPRRAFLRDARACAWSIAQLRELWPLASPWMLARRLVDLVDGATAAQWSRSMRCTRRLGPRRQEEERAVIESGGAFDAGTAWILAIPPPV